MELLYSLAQTTMQSILHGQISMATLSLYNIRIIYLPYTPIFQKSMCKSMKCLRLEQKSVRSEGQEWRLAVICISRSVVGMSRIILRHKILNCGWFQRKMQAGESLEQ